MNHARVELLIIQKICGKELSPFPAVQGYRRRKKTQLSTPSCQNLTEAIGIIVIGIEAERGDVCGGVGDLFNQE